MADEPRTLSINDQSIDSHIITLFQKLETLKNEDKQRPSPEIPLKVEIRTLEFWRSVISECFASFIYVFIVCSASIGASSNVSVPSISLLLISTALATGVSVVSLTQCFGHISGAHINPAVTVAMGITKNISFLRMKMFVIAQCGGAIAGAAFLRGINGRSGNQSISIHTFSISETPWEKFGVECVLSFMVVFSYFVSMDSHNRWMNKSALTIGATYSACSFISPLPRLNPARSLGPSFVFNEWENHWVYWVGPTLGGALAGLLYEYSFTSKKRKRHHRERDLEGAGDGDSSSMNSSEEDTYDDLDKPTNAPPSHQSSAKAASSYHSYRPCQPPPALAMPSKPESIYGGTKSLYYSSPPLTRANLNRSQSVYAKSNSAVNRENLLLPKPGPLVPAQSLYPIKLLSHQQNYVQNQNMQNQQHQQQQQRGYATTERSIYSNSTNHFI